MSSRAGRGASIRIRTVNLRRLGLTKMMIGGRGRKALVAMGLIGRRGGKKGVSSAIPNLDLMRLITTVIMDSAVFAIISRVNKVIVGAHAVMANGGVVAPVGLNMVALAAERHAVPFVVLAGAHKLCPLYPHNPEVLLNELKSPSELLDFGEFSDCLDFGSAAGSPLLHVVNPAFDYVPPKLVSLFITDIGGHNPSYMYRLIADYYSADDIVILGRCMALFQATSDVPEQGAVDDRDTFLHGVRDLLSIYSNAQAGLSTYVSVPGIVQQLSNLHSELMTLQSDLEYALPEDRNRCINDLCTLVQSLQQLLFASSTTAQPILTPWTLMKELDEMEKVNAKLSTAVEDVTLEHCKKNEIVKHHSQEMALQRRVFVDFFCNPERLRNQVKELTARVRALQAS